MQNSPFFADLQQREFLFSTIYSIIPGKKAENAYKADHRYSDSHDHNNDWFEFYDDTAEQITDYE